MEDPYTDADPEYASTPLVSPIPPPNSFSAPRLNIRREGGAKRGRGRDGGYQSNSRGSYRGGDRGGGHLRRGYHSERRLPYDPSLFRQLIDHIPSDVKDISSFEDLGQISYLNAPVPYLVDAKQLQYFKMLESELSKKGPHMLRSALMRSSPSYRVGRLLFNSQEGAQLANLDAALKITEHLAGATFLEVSSVPGKFSEYLLWRKTHDLRGCGLYTGPVPIQHFVFHPQCQAADRYEYLSKEEMSWSEASDLVVYRFESGKVKLAIADLPSVDSKSEDSPVYQKQLLSNALLCLQALQPGGLCLLKVAGISTEVSFQLVWLLRKLFKQLSIIRPLSLGSLSGCIFLYFQDLVQETRMAIQVLTSALDALETSARPLHRFLNRDHLDSDTRLCDLIQNLNSRLISTRIDTAKLAIKYVEDSSKPPIGPPTPDMQSYARMEWSLDY